MTYSSPISLWKMHQPLKSNGEPKGRLVPPSVMGFDFLQLTRMDIFRTSAVNESSVPLLFYPYIQYIFWLMRWMAWFDKIFAEYPSLNRMLQKHSSNVMCVELFSGHPCIRDPGRCALWWLSEASDLLRSTLPTWQTKNRSWQDVK